ncbi:HAD family hydrolase [Sedimentimonas flavescens]|uniref:HAD family hydrolase n=1 Tax=Sedimentimonas flavescens TaxID=2851012 RepID=UPI001C4A3D64|nr:HAD family hydrolase [Sedimentimonas flavescens]MBW0157723.1 HAD hydrolase-like protein [Sedimentimonas flavescens]
MRTVVFDLDGTLADTSADLIAAANACFEARGLGRPLDPVGDALIAFHGGRAMLRAGYARLNEARAEDLIEADYRPLLDHYAAHICVETRLYPGAAEAVEALRGQGYATAICTNKPEYLARDLVAQLGVAGLFGALIGADTLPVRKPDPAPYRAAVAGVGGDAARSILIGDTVTDRETARAAGVPCALVTFGPEGRGIERLAPEALLEHYGDLPELAGRFLPD